MTELETILSILGLILPPILTYLLAVAKKNPQIKDAKIKYQQTRTLLDEIENATFDNEITDVEFERIVKRGMELLQPLPKSNP